MIFINWLSNSVRAWILFEGECKEDVEQAPVVPNWLLALDLLPQKNG